MLLAVALLAASPFTFLDTFADVKWGDSREQIAASFDVKPKSGFLHHERDVNEHLVNVTFEFGYGTNRLESIWLAAYGEPGYFCEEAKGELIKRLGMPLLFDHRNDRGEGRTLLEPLDRWAAVWTTSDTRFELRCRLDSITLTLAQR